MLIKPAEIKKIEAKLEECSVSFVALGDPMRQKLLLELAIAGEDGRNVTELTSNHLLSRPAISHHLKILKNAGMIISHKKGTQVYYFVQLKYNLNKIKEIIKIIDSVLENINIEELKEKAPWMNCN